MKPPLDGRVSSLKSSTPVPHMLLIVQFHSTPFTWFVADNVGILIPHLSRQNGTDPGEIRAYLEIGEDFEDIC